MNLINFNSTVMWAFCAKFAAFGKFEFNMRLLIQFIVDNQAQTCNILDKI